MADAPYSIRLASGQYLYSDGTFHEYPPARSPTFNAPGGLLPVNLSSVSATLSSVGGALTDLNKFDANGNPTSDAAKALVGLGIDADALKALGSVANIAKTLALATGIIGVAVVLSALINLSADPNAGLKAYLDKLFADEFRLIQGIEMTTRKTLLVEQKSVIDESLDLLSSFQAEITNYNLTGQAWTEKTTALMREKVCATVSRGWRVYLGRAAAVPSRRACACWIAGPGVSPSSCWRVVRARS